MSYIVLIFRHLYYICSHYFPPCYISLCFIIIYSPTLSNKLVPNPSFTPHHLLVSCFIYVTLSLHVFPSYLLPLSLSFSHLSLPPTASSSRKKALPVSQVKGREATGEQLASTSFLAAQPSLPVVVVVVVVDVWGEVVVVVMVLVVVALQSYARIWTQLP